MTATGRRIKLDENLSRHLKSLIEHEGYLVTTAEEEGLLGRSESEVAAAAKAENSVLFTLDLEFADLRKHPPGQHPGVILFRPKSMGPRSVSEFVLDFVRHVDLSSLGRCVVVVEPQSIRVRRPRAEG